MTGTWELTAHDIDGGGSIGRGTVSVQDFSESDSYGEGEGAWGSCSGWCSPNSQGKAGVYLDGQFLSLVLEGSTPAGQSLTGGWLTARSLSPAGKDAYEGIAKFGVYSAEVKCYSSTLIRVSKVSDTPTYSVP